MDFTASTESIDQLAEARVERLITMLKEVSRYGHISLESQQELHLFPHDELARAAEVNLGLETVVSHIKSTLKAIVAAVARVWRKAVDWVSGLFTRRRQDAQKTEQNWSEAETASESLDEWLRKHGTTAYSELGKKFRDVLDKHLPALASMSNGLTDDITSGGKLSGGFTTMEVALKGAVENFNKALVEFNRHLEEIQHETGRSDYIDNVYTSTLRLLQPSGFVVFDMLRKEFGLDKELSDGQVITAIRVDVQQAAGTRPTHPLTFKDFHWGKDGQFDRLQQRSRWFIKNEGAVKQALDHTATELRQMEAIRDAVMSPHVRTQVNQTLTLLKGRISAVHQTIALLGDIVALEHRISTVFKQAYTEACHAVGLHPDSVEARDYLHTHPYY